MVCERTVIYKILIVPCTNGACIASESGWCKRGLWPSSRCSSNKQNQSWRQRSAITHQTQSALWVCLDLTPLEPVSQVKSSLQYTVMGKSKSSLRSALRGYCSRLLLANQLWSGFRQGHPQLMGHATPWRWNLLVWILCSYWCIESVWPSRRAEGNGAVLRVNYTQSHTQFSPANLVREGRRHGGINMLWGATYVRWHACVHEHTH